MRKSKIVSYSSEEVKQLPDESDYAANAAMTDEEILAAIADDPDDSELLDWHPRQTNKPTDDPFVIFVFVHDSQGRPTMHRVSEIIPDKKSGYVRIKDDTGRVYRVMVRETEDVERSAKRKAG